MKDISVIIISYNTRDITAQCINHLITCLDQTPTITAEIIVIDNASTDGSIIMLEEMQKKHAKRMLLIKNKENSGFSRANNVGFARSTGKYVLFLNSDVYIKDVNFEDLLYYMNNNQNVGVLTVRVQLPNGTIDKASHRGFPTIWNSFTYFAKLEKIFAKIPYLSKYFGEYHLTHLDMNTIHEIDSPTGAFYLTRASILKEIDGFDTDYFMYGEDLDLSFRIKKLGYKIIYYPLFTVVHLKHRSGLKTKKTAIQKKTGEHFYDAMDIFYDKHFAHKNSRIENALTHMFIRIKSKLPR